MTTMPETKVLCSIKILFYIRPRIFCIRTIMFNYFLYQNVYFLYQHAYFLYLYELFACGSRLKTISQPFTKSTLSYVLSSVLCLVLKDLKSRSIVSPVCSQPFKKITLSYVLSSLLCLVLKDLNCCSFYMKTCTQLVLNLYIMWASYSNLSCCTI